MSKAAIMSGSCLCGRVTYSIGDEVAFVAVCHCTHCQKQTGTSFALQMAVPRSNFEIRGDVKTFGDTGDSGRRVDRTFCPDCGSPIYARAELKPDLLFVFAGTLSDPSKVTPSIQIYCDSAQPWLHLDGLQTFPKMPG